MRANGIAILLGFILVALCAPLAAQSSRPIYLYSLETNGAGAPPLHAFTMNSLTGALSEISGSPFSVGSNPCCIAVDPTGRFVYVLNSSSNDITGFSVSASTGILTPLPGSPFVTGNNPVSLAIDPTGRFLYVSAYTAASVGLKSSSVYEYTIDSGTGVLATAVGSSFTQAEIISSITFNPKGNYAFLTQTLASPSALLIDSFDFANGGLVNVGSILSDREGVVSTAMDFNGKILYTVEPSGRIGAFTFDQTQAALVEIQGSPFSGPNIPTKLVVHPNGKFLYGVDGSIIAFTIDPVTGALTLMPGSPVSSGIPNPSIAVDPTGHFVYIPSKTTDSASISYGALLGFLIDPAIGALTPFPGLAWKDSVQFSVADQVAISYGPVGTPNPVPLLSSLSPSSATAGSAGFVLQVNGANFVQGATVYFGGQARNTTFVSATQLNADILNGDIANGGTAVVFVFNPLPGGGASTSMGFTVINPSPTLSSINPSSAVAGGAGFTLAVNGSNFVTGSVVNFNGTARSATYVSSTKLTITISAGEIANQGTVSITVTNIANGTTGGGTSGSVTLTILPASVQPTIGTLVPASATAGGPAFTLTVTGSGFTLSSVVSFNLNSEPTTYVSATQLQAAIPASAIALAGSPVVVVTNPGLGVSFLSTFVVNNPLPGGVNVSPPSLPAGRAALTLNVTGMNFTQGSKVLVNGSSRVTTYVSSTSLQATLLPSDLSRGGTLNITVSNPPPGGGTTAGFSFTVADYSVTPPTSPTSVAAGQPADFSLIVAPSNGTFSNPITFTATGLPTGTTATFSPSATFTPGATPTTVTFVVMTKARSSVWPKASPPPPEHGWPSTYLIVAVLGAMVLALRNSVAGVRRLVPQFLLVMLLVIAAGLVACGAVGGGTSPTPQINPAIGTPAGTYSILVTATSGSAAHTTTVTLTVM